ncbi:dihydrofolate reductase family protein [Microcella sp.]|uniref:dihydrofolate reductase family protein n=1 Tax=Microcella sp. TaxID=1913979 RepID=UPI00299F5CE7|nr:dihydrofolate reductase family protein [Microcella sp.]MDX2025513.1 dihydrofolate reductase family protein [Microcella sp.]
MIMRRVVPGSGGELDLDAPDTRSTLLAWYAPHSPEYVRLNLVSTLDGHATGPDGTSESLTSRADRMILGAIRELADVVVVGAETVRREGLGRPRRAALAIVTASGDLAGHRLDDHDDRTTPVIVVTTAAGAEQAAATAPSATVWVLDSAPTSRIDPAVIVHELRRQGFTGIVVEGGPTLAGQFMRAGLVDEVCLTVMPRLGGSSVPVLADETAVMRSLTVTQLLVDDSGAQFGRWSLR